MGGVLDPSQNNAFLDSYLDVPVDLPWPPVILAEYSVRAICARATFWEIKPGKSACHEKKQFEVVWSAVKYDTYVGDKSTSTGLQRVSSKMGTPLAVLV